MGSSGLRPVSVAFASLLVASLTLPSSGLRAQTPAPVPPAQCDVVDSDAASNILGYSVGAADARSRAAGICFFSTRAVSENGLVSYAVVTPERLPQRRAFFTALARMCAGVAKVAPRAAQCATYVRLARAEDLDDYFAARTSGSDAVPVPHLADAAFSAGGTLYVRRPGDVFEIDVRRERAFDLERSIDLAKLLLQRTP